ncbi:MAG: 4Fe-4S dicluster domain-containing protein [Promethearchaeia archaeon]
MKFASKQLEQKIKELSNRIYKAITVGGCIGCGTCIKYCPLEIRAFNSHNRAKTINSHQNCGGCSVCVKRCPQNAIELFIFERKSR